jgi:peptide/nickel transport system permease protein/oligopeptide transport system permease protein
MLSEARSFMLPAPWLMVFPGLAILTTVLAFVLLGDGLRDALDVKMKE